MGLLESPQEILIAHSSFRYIKSNILISTIRVFNRMQSLKTNTKTITMVMLALCTMCVVQIHGVDPNGNESEPKRRRLVGNPLKWLLTLTGVLSVAGSHSTDPCASLSENNAPLDPPVYYSEYQLERDASMHYRTRLNECQLERDGLQVRLYENKDKDDLFDAGTTLRNQIHAKDKEIIRLKRNLKKAGQLCYDYNLDHPLCYSEYLHLPSIEPKAGRLQLKNKTPLPVMTWMFPEGGLICGGPDLW